MQANCVFFILNRNFRIKLSSFRCSQKSPLVTTGTCEVVSAVLWHPVCGLSCTQASSCILPVLGGP